MIDDHNKCKWVNVSSVQAHLGCSGQKPESHKMVIHCESKKTVPLLFLL